MLPYYRLKENTTLQHGKYRIIRLVAEDSSSHTYEAACEGFGSNVLIKEVFCRDYYFGNNRDYVKYSEFREEGLRRFRQEAKRIANIHHPSVVNIIDVFDENNTSYYVADWIDGESLYDLVQREGPMPEGRAISFVLGIARIIEYLHSRGVLHLNLSPEAIIVTKRKKLVVTDFGWYKHFERVVRDVEDPLYIPMDNAIRYAAPEIIGVINGYGSLLSAQSDVFSLGMLLYYLVTGNTPPEYCNVALKRDRQFHSYDKLSAGIRTIIDRASAYECSERVQTVHEFIDLFQGLITLPPEKTRLGNQSGNIQIPRLEIIHLQKDTLLQEGKYRIIRFISSGGFGCTYEAVHTMFGSKVCIKEFFIDSFCSRDSKTQIISVVTKSKRELMQRLRDKFREEAKAIFNMHHPGIVRVTDIFEENNTVYYVMDFIEGESLMSMVRRKGPLPEAEALKYIRQVASALEYVHSLHRLHLDVKPANIMVTAEGKAVLIDFGASKYYDPETGDEKSEMLGINTPGYAPIEQVACALKTFSPATDIYALGATFYNLITGITPPTSVSLANDDETLPQLPPRLFPGTTRAIEAAMQLRRRDRPQAVHEFVQLLDTGTPPTPPESPCADSTSENTMYVSEETEISDYANASEDSGEVPQNNSESFSESYYYYDYDSPKPIYKRVWVWIAGVIIALCAICIGIYFGGGFKDTSGYYDGAPDNVQPPEVVVPEMTVEEPAVNEVKQDDAALRISINQNLSSLRSVISDAETTRTEIIESWGGSIVSDLWPYWTEDLQKANEMVAQLESCYGSMDANQRMTFEGLKKRLQRASVDPSAEGQAMLESLQ